ncbi:pseudouridine synthase, partial [Ramicandelaber brevisporus]
IQCGHGGTLDPDASGVLVLGLGKRGCKMLGQQLLGGKAYEATMIFGIETTTGDQSGTSLKTALPVSPDLITREHISAVLPRFRGKISQLPPLYSAIKINGKPMYEYARAGETPPREIAERIVEISRLELVDYPSPSTVNGVDWSFKSPLLNEAQGEYQTPRIRISTECSGGTYIRSLIRDLGEAAGSLAYMDELVRIQQGPIQLNRHTIELEECADLDKVRGAL